MYSHVTTQPTIFFFQKQTKFTVFRKTDFFLHNFIIPMYSLINNKLKKLRREKYVFTHLQFIFAMWLTKSTKNTSQNEKK
jgi:hypothetical protein